MAKENRGTRDENLKKVLSEAKRHSQSSRNKSAVSDYNNKKAIRGYLMGGAKC
jgi:hypothetical protein